MAWRFRRSMRLPGGFRLNVSKNGLGYSWGFRGFRIGRDNRGRVVRTLSVPGTGLYNRQYLSKAVSQGVTQGKSSGMGCGGCVGTIFLFLLILGALAQLIESGNITGLILVLLVVMVGYVIRKFRFPATAAPTEVTPRDYEWLGHEVKVRFLELEMPIKNQLRKSRGATGYEILFEMSITDLICRFASLAGGITAPEAKVFLDIFKVLHPKRYASLSAEDAVTLLQGHRQRSPESVAVPFSDSLIFRLSQRAGEPFANDLKALMSKIALQVALADGPLSQSEQAELDALRDPSRPTGRSNEAAEAVQEPNAEEASEPLAAANESDAEAVVPTARRQIIDPQFTCATGVVTIDILKEGIKKLVETSEPLLKEEYRRVRKSSIARELLEQDIRAIIIRAGFTGGSISDYAAHLYLEIFRCLHPRTYAGWTLDTSRSVVTKILEGGRDTYLGALKKPHTIEVLERIDSAHGTGATKSARDIFLILAIFAASSEGRLSSEKEAEIIQMTTVFEMIGQGHASLADGQ